MGQLVIYHFPVGARQEKLRSKIEANLAILLFCAV